MTKPNTQAYFFGNKLTRIFLGLFGVFITYGCITQPNDYGFGALLIIWVMNWAGYKSAQEIATYNSYQAEWKAADAPAGPGMVTPTLSFRRAAWFLGLEFWGFYGFGAIVLAQRGETDGIVYFSVVTAVFVAWRLLRRSWRRAPRVSSGADFCHHRCEVHREFIGSGL